MDDLNEKELLTKIFKMVNDKNESKPPKPKQTRNRTYTEEQRAELRERLAKARVKALETRRANSQAKKQIKDSPKVEPQTSAKDDRYDKLLNEIADLKKHIVQPKQTVVEPPKQTVVEPPKEPAKIQPPVAVVEPPKKKRYESY